MRQIRDETDIVAASLGWNRNMKNVTRLGIAMMHSRYSLYIPTGHSMATHLWAYLEAFYKETWAVCGIMVLVVAMTFSGMPFVL